jgi:hypothetical protein
MLGEKQVGRMTGTPNSIDRIPLDNPHAPPSSANLIPIQVDLIEAVTGHQNLTHAWNESGLRASVVERVARRVFSTPGKAS